MAFKMNGWSAFTAQPPPPTRPQSGDYATHEEYINALKAWQAAKAAKAEEKEKSTPPLTWKEEEKEV